MSIPRSAQTTFDIDDGEIFENADSTLTGIQMVGERRLNTVWKDVMEDEQLDHQMNSVDLHSNERLSHGDLCRIERGPESFYVSKTIVRKFQARRQKRQMKKMKLQATGNYDGETSSEKTSTTIDTNSSNNGSMTSSAIITCVDSTQNTSPKRKRKMRKPFQINKTRSLLQPRMIEPLTTASSIDEFVNELSEKLNEKRQLISTVVEKVGVTITTAIYNRVIKIEKEGGMLTQDGLRRRTTGGIFLHLLLHHPQTTLNNDLRKSLQAPETRAHKRRLRRLRLKTAMELAKLNTAENLTTVETMNEDINNGLEPI